jgi:hypothetical protein
MIVAADEQITHPSSSAVDWGAFLCVWLESCLSLESTYRFSSAPAPCRITTSGSWDLLSRTFSARYVFLGFDAYDKGGETAS